MAKDNTIYFDSQDWDSIRDTIDKINRAGELQIGETDEGETIIFDVTPEGYLQTEVLQKNGWVRTNVYDTDDFIINETYKRGDR